MTEKPVHEPVPYFTFESITARFERTIKRLWILSIILFIATIVSNAAWIYSMQQ